MNSAAQLSPGRYTPSGISNALRAEIDRNRITGDEPPLSSTSTETTTMQSNTAENLPLPSEAQTTGDTGLGVSNVRPFIGASDNAAAAVLTPTATQNTNADDAGAGAQAPGTGQTADSKTESASDSETGDLKVFRVTGTNRLIRAASKWAANKHVSPKLQIREADVNDVLSLFLPGTQPEVIGTIEGKGKVFVQTIGDKQVLLRGNKLSEVVKARSVETKLEVVSAEDLLEALSSGAQIESVA